MSSETVNYSGRYTFEFDEFLQPSTTVTATVIYGQTISPDGNHPLICIKSWSFTTGDFPTWSPTSTPTPMPSGEGTDPTDPGNALEYISAGITGLIFVAGNGGIMWSIIRKR